MPGPHDPDDFAYTGRTGPRTAAGKARSRMNALTHGLTARTPLLPDEDPEQFRLFVWEVVRDLAPAGVVQLELAHRAALLMWKRRRVGLAEDPVITALGQRFSDEAAQWVADCQHYADTPEEKERAKAERRDEEENGPVYDAQQIMAEGLDVVAEKEQWAASHRGALERLAKYERRIDAQIDSTLRLLLKLQNQRRGEQGEERQRRQREEDRTRPDQTPPAPAAAASDPPPPAPAQNEMPARATEKAPAPQPAPWTGPPGVN